MLDLSKTVAGAKIIQISALATEKLTKELLAGSSVSGLLYVDRNINTANPTNDAVAGSPTISSPSQNDNMTFWYPILFGLYEIVMTCDLEVRTRGLTYLFDALKIHGTSFSQTSWEIITKGVLFPIFNDLKEAQKENNTKVAAANKEDVSVWMSTTLIQALRLFVDLFGQYMENLLFCIDGVLELLTLCMTQGKIH